MTNYNIASAIGTTSSKDSSYMTAGIHENCKLADVRFDVSANGNKYLSFDFLDKDGNKLSHTEWEPVVQPGWAPNALEVRTSVQMTKVLQIMKVYIPVETLANAGTINGFDDFALWVVGSLKKADLSKPIRLKTVYSLNNKSGKEYVSLPPSGAYTFIESMEVQPSRIRQLQSDKFERQYSPDKEVKTVNPLIVTDAEEEDLPF